VEAREAVKQWLERGEAVAVATVVATRRSAPRPLGSKLAVSSAGELAGSVSGGCVESDVAEHAREVLASGSPKLVSYGIADEDAWSVGLPCGGEIDVFVERVERELPDPEVAQTVFTVVEGSRIGARWLAAGGTRQTGMLELDGERVFAESLGPPPRLLVFGAVDLAEALCRAAKGLGWRTVVVDARARFATAARLPSADEIVVAWPEDALAQLAPDERTAVVVLTHEERWDVPALAGALGSPAFYVGALGSRRTQASRRERLLEAGVGEEQLARLHGPAGLDLGASTPAETALSILAEIVATRAGRDGRPLRASSGAIHAEPALPPAAEGR
jgi:xanthine dehydrogenase accessory factor